ncbi:hypothetical protein GGI42DRAFT_87387 [Trichoderma sp. SZMC 28013]
MYPQYGALCKPVHVPTSPISTRYVSTVPIRPPSSQKHQINHHHDFFPFFLFSFFLLCFPIRLWICNSLILRPQTTANLLPVFSLFSLLLLFLLLYSYLLTARQVIARPWLFGRLPSLRQVTSEKSRLQVRLYQPRMAEPIDCHSPGGDSECKMHAKCGQVKKKAKRDQQEESPFIIPLLFNICKPQNNSSNPPFISGHLVSALTPFPGVLKVQLFLAAYLLRTRMCICSIVNLASQHTCMYQTARTSLSPLILSWTRISLAFQSSSPPILPPPPVTSFHVLPLHLVFILRHGKYQSVDGKKKDNNSPAAYCIPEAPWISG